MKTLLLFLLVLATACRTAQPPQKPWVLSPLEAERQSAIGAALDGHPPVEVYDLEAAPDSIATVVAEYWYLNAKDWTKKAKKLPK